MANPFSAVPTAFMVETADYTSFSNCIWDSLGVAAMLGQDVRIHTSCADCGSAVELQAIGGHVTGDEIMLHFGLPALHWWDDIVYT